MAEIKDVVAGYPLPKDLADWNRIWLLDLSSQVDASTELVGLDADISQVGAQEWLPQNMSLREWNAFTDPPKDLQAKFDIVNLRLFCYVIQDDPTIVLRNVIKLLSKYMPWKHTG
ncbi:hypothetical protein KJ359_006848 [Pestalotiopsis sp. 9143b]|nr:hypothetical protein KJ359_006848 [Pestalotiopsis sp. 9143b]